MTPSASIPAAKQKRSKLAETSSNALPTASIAGEVNTAAVVLMVFMALLSFRGISTPSLPAQGEQRRSSFFNKSRDIPLESIRRSCAMPLRSRRRVVAGRSLSRRDRHHGSSDAQARHQACDEIPSTNVLLRGGADGIRALSADQEAWSRLHRGGPLAHPEKAGRSCKDEPARCDGLGQVIARRGIDRGLGAR